MTAETRDTEREAHAAIDRIAAYEANWDSYGAPPMASEIVECAHEVVDALKSVDGDDAIGPYPGGIAIEVSDRVTIHCEERGEIRAALRVHPEPAKDRPRDWKRDCQEWVMEGIACADCQEGIYEWLEGRSRPEPVEAEPVATFTLTGDHAHDAGFRLLCGGGLPRGEYVVYHAGTTPPAPQTEASEPVAWGLFENGYFQFADHNERATHAMADDIRTGPDCRGEVKVVPLYATPPAPSSSPSTEALRLLAKHRRHVERSVGGVGGEKTSYALRVLDDLEDDLRTLSTTHEEEPEDG